MLTDRDVQELLHYRPSHPVLSIYLNTDPAEGNADAYRLRLRSMLKEVDLEEDSKAILRYFEHEHDWSGRSVALFSCAPDGFFKAFPLAVPIRSRVRVGEQPYVKPLANLLDSYGGYGVILVDKQGARMFSFHLGELTEQEGVMGEEVRHTKRGGGTQTGGQRGGAGGTRGGVAGKTDYEAEIAERNMKEVIEFSTRFFNEHNVRRVVIAGTDDNVARFRAQMPKAWQSLLIGTFSCAMTAQLPEIMEKAMEVGRRVEREREAHLAEAIVTSTAKGKMGVTGLEDTLNAVREGRVQSLVIRDGYRSPGYRCTGCGYLVAKSKHSCPFCGSKFEKIEDAVEMAVRQAMETGADVEVITQDQSIKGFDQIGALLRY